MTDKEYVLMLVPSVHAYHYDDGDCMLRVDKYEDLWLEVCLCYGGEEQAWAGSRARLERFMLEKLES